MSSQFKAAKKRKSQHIRINIISQYYFPFAFDDVSDQSDSEFEAIYQVNGFEYRYGFTYNAKRVEYEWLYRTSLASKRLSHYFQKRAFAIIRNQVVGMLFIRLDCTHIKCDLIFKWAIVFETKHNKHRTPSSRLILFYKKEIDFVAIRRSEKLYIQVSDNISDEKTFQREVGSLLQIKDAYPKILLARTDFSSCNLSPSISANPVVSTVFGFSLCYLAVSCWSQFGTLFLYLSQFWSQFFTPCLSAEASYKETYFISLRILCDITLIKNAVHIINIVGPKDALYRLSYSSIFALSTGRYI